MNILTFKRRKLFLLACIGLLSIALCAHWLSATNRGYQLLEHIGKSLESDSPAHVSESQAPNLVVPQTSTPPPLHDFDWHYKRMLKQIDASLYRFDWKRYMPLMRQLPSETSREFRVKVGREWMRSQGLVVAATLRNAMQGMPDSLKNADRLRAMFNRSWVVIVETDSTDGTRDWLHDLSKKDPSVRLLGCGNLNSRDPCRPVVKYRSGRQHQPGWNMDRNRDEQIDRGQVMSALRNMYLEYTYDYLVPQGATLILLIDADMTWKQWDLDNIAQGLYYFGAKPKLQQLCAHSCFWNRAKVTDPCSLTFFNNKHFGEDRTKPVITYEDLRNPSPDFPPVKVSSCFQALAFYRLSDMSTKRIFYGGVPDEWICEHNTLSRNLEEVYIDPQMIVDVENLFNG